MIVVPLVLWDLWMGATWFLVMLLIFGFCLGREWSRMVGPKVWWVPWIYHVGTVWAVACCAFGSFLLAFLGITVLGIAQMAWFFFQGKRPSFWQAVGPWYLGLPIIALCFLRGDTEMGFLYILYLLLVIWTCDTCAFLVGRTVGGPKIWPEVSPKKTWSGLLGAMTGGGLMSWGLTQWLAWGHGEIFLLFGAVLGIVEQMGDFFESAAKRACGVKDSGRLFPGHGGVLDRVDGLLFAACFMASGVFVYTRVLTS